MATFMHQLSREPCLTETVMYEANPDTSRMLDTWEECPPYETKYSALGNWRMTECFFIRLVISKYLMMNIVFIMGKEKLLPLIPHQSLAFAL